MLVSRGYYGVDTFRDLFALFRESILEFTCLISSTRIDMRHRTFVYLPLIPLIPRLRSQRSALSSSIRCRANFLISQVFSIECYLDDDSNTSRHHNRTRHNDLRLVVSWISVNTIINYELGPFSCSSASCCPTCAGFGYIWQSIHTRSLVHQFLLLELEYPRFTRPQVQCNRTSPAILLALDCWQEGRLLER